MQENAKNLESLNKPVLEAFEQAKAQPATAQKVFPFDGDFADLHSEVAEDIFRFNVVACGLDVGPDVEISVLREAVAKHCGQKDAGFRRKLEEKGLDKLGLADINNELAEVVSGKYRPLWKRLIFRESFRVKEQQKLVGYDYDGAFPLLIRYLTPRGLRGFVLAALMGAVISSLASMLNAASTIFTMDIYREWFNKNAAQKVLVWVGRCCVPIGVIVGCLIAPVLANPRFKGAFAFIQEFQGFVSPGVLTIFLFGLFVKWTPRYCGVLGLILSPIIYGILFFGWGDMAFLNRMAITVGAISVILLLITLFNPMKEKIALPEQTKIELNWSKGSVYFGVFVTILTVVLYIIFW